MMVNGIILTNISQRLRKLENGMEMMMEYVLNTLSPVASIISAPTRSATSTARMMMVILKAILWLIFIFDPRHQNSKLFCSSFVFQENLLVLSFEDYSDSV